MSEGLPKGWATAKFVDAVTNHDGRRIPLKSTDRDRRPGKYPYYGASGVIDDIDDFLFDGEFLLVAEDGANLLSRSTPIAFRASGKFWVNNHAHVVQPRADIDIRWLEHYLNNFDLTFHVTGTAQPKLTQNALNEIPIRLAPLAEQRRIVGKLEELLSKVESSYNRLEQIPRILKRFRQAVLAVACSGRLTADWRESNGQNDRFSTRQLSELGSVTGGITKNAKRNSLRLRVPYLRVANVYENSLDLKKVLEIGVTREEYERTALKKNDLLFVEGNGSLDQIGRVAIWDGSIPRCVHQNHLIKFRPAAAILPTYVLFQMMAPQGRAQLIEKSTSSAGLNTLSISKISAVYLPVPSLAEQQEVVRRVEVLFAFAASIEDRYAKAKSAVDRMVQAILAKAFGGELVPTEAELSAAEGREYESAEELLARIATQENSRNHQARQHKTPSKSRRAAAR